ncbi:MAG: tetratricopeptide repeat protein [Chloroflexales bacterium]|nr:tetratricopeptide repeat protein [Chloroflexales bacterium]
MSPFAEQFAPPPQTGRIVRDAPETEAQNLWKQLLATVYQVGHALDPFAADLDPSIRALGRTARQRNPRRADDYFALGDLCAQLSLDGVQLKLSYAEKTLIAYGRAGECSLTDEAVARRASLAYVLWLTGVARSIGTYHALEVGTAICERAVRLEIVAADSAPGEQLRNLVKQLRAQMNQLIDLAERAADSVEPTPLRISRRLCDEGQIALRHQRTTEALEIFARVIDADPQNATAYLWQALALTDVARFDEALASYERALQLEPFNYGAWNNWGALLMDLGKLSEALACFERALEIPQAAPVVQAAFLLNKGKALFLMERYAEAHTALFQSDQLDPTPESAAGVTACDEMLGRAQTEDAGQSATKI